MILFYLFLKRFFEYSAANLVSMDATGWTGPAVHRVFLGS